MERRLTTILAADLAGYSRLMAADEEGVLERLRSIRADIVDPAIAGCHGRIVKVMGDGILAEFPSPVEAVRCALMVQNTMAERETGPTENRLRFRVGINLGDVIVEDGDLFGDAVNIAARLESLAAPGGICIGRTVFDQLRGKISAPLAPLGPQLVKNLPEPVEAWRVGTAVGFPAPPAKAAERPSVAVLPFDNLSSDPEQNFLAEGIVEDVITELSRFRSLLVIARNSTMAYRGARDARRIAAELGARYLVEGSVRRSGNRLRVTAQLIEAASATHLWAERWDRTVADLFDLQDELTRAIVSGVEPELGAHERDLARCKPAESLTVWELYQRAMTVYATLTDANVSEARRLASRAIEQDPQFAAALCLLARIDAVTALFGWTADRAEMIESALKLARQALAIDPRLDEVYRALGLALSVAGRHAEALEALTTGVQLNGNNPSILFGRAQARLARPSVDSAELAAAIDDLDMALRLSPRDPLAWLFLLVRGIGHEMRGSAEGRRQALDDLWRATLAVNAGWPAFMSYALVLLRAGDADAARRQVAAVLKVHPGLSIEQSATTVPLPWLAGTIRELSADLVGLGLPLR